MTNLDICSVHRDIQASRLDETKVSADTCEFLRESSSSQIWKMRGGSSGLKYTGGGLL